MQLSSLISQIKKIIPEQQAWWLLEKLTGKPQGTLLAQDEIELADYQMDQLEQWLYDIENNSQPIQYILGSVPFCDVDILVEPPVLIPRQETEDWLRDLIKKLKPFQDKQLKILDLCCGSGCIGLTLAHHFPNFKIIQSDIAPHAIALSQKNKSLIGVDNVTIVPSDLFELLDTYGPYDLIITNPPYIPSEAYKKLDSSVKEWEDKLALEAGADGLSLIKKIINQAPEYLSSDHPMELPRIVMEIDATQGDAISSLINNSLFSSCTIEKDNAQRDRVAYIY